LLDNYRFITNMKWRCRPPDSREERMRKLCLKAPASVVEDYFHLFVNRRAYTLQSNRPHPESARHYYYRPKDKKTGQGLSLTPDTIRRHLEGEITIGLYAINPATQCSKWVAIDADYEDSLADLLKLSFHLRQDGVESALEKSHRGGHLWIFLAEPLPARDCCTYLCGADLHRAAQLVCDKTLAMGTRYTHLAPDNKLAAVQRLVASFPDS
jgi:hypothetical protein